MITQYSLLQMAGAIQAALNVGAGATFYAVQNSGTVNPDITEAEVIADATPSFTGTPLNLDAWDVATDPVTADNIVYHPAGDFNGVSTAAGGIIAGIIAVDNASHVLGGVFVNPPVTFTAVGQLFEAQLRFRVGVGGADMEISQ